MRTLFALCALSATAVLLDAAPAPTRSQDSLFPAASQGLTIPARGPDGWTMTQLLQEYGRITDQHFMISDDTRNLLETATVPIDQELAIAPEFVHSVVESFLIETDFVIAIMREANPRLVSVKSLNSSARNNMREQARYVPVEDLVEWRDHPAQLISTVVSLDSIDVRTLTNSMRAMLTDANTQSIIPVGNSNSLILTGFGPQVEHLARMLQRVNDHEREWLESQPLPEPVPEKEEAR